YKLSLEKKLDKVKEILNKHNKIVYYIEFIKYAKSLELFNEPETKEIFEQIKNNSIIFSECSIEEIIL
ncbi:MAG: hypothetical protein WC002_03640, partial [Candidatus Muiribacteriota bacterium]